MNTSHSHAAGDNPRHSEDHLREAELVQIRDALRGLRFGAVNIVVQDGVVVQIDRTEKRRLVRRPASEATK